MKLAVFLGVVIGASPSVVRFALPTEAPGCSRREPVTIADYKRAAAEAPSSLPLQIALASCYDTAWQFELVGPAIERAIAILATQPPAPISGTTPPARPVAGADVPAPKRTRDKQPNYPREASLRGFNGLVVLEILIDPKGEVREASAAKSVPGLDDEAIKAARQWRYEPTLVGGQATEVLAYAPVRFGPAPDHGASDWLEVAAFHDRQGAGGRARAALIVAIDAAHEDLIRFGGYVDSQDKASLEGVTLPAVKKQVEPNYPRRALSSGSREGKVRIEALVDRLGNIARPRIVGAPSQFDTAALEAALQWRFVPAQKLGGPVPSRVLLEMEFRSHQPFASTGLH